MSNKQNEDQNDRGMQSITPMWDVPGLGVVKAGDWFCFGIDGAWTPPYKLNGLAMTQSDKFVTRINCELRRFTKIRLPTVADWAKTMPEEIRERFLGYVPEDFLTKQVREKEYVFDVCNCGFGFPKTSEPNSFWDEVRCAFENNTPYPELPKEEGSEPKGFGCLSNEQSDKIVMDNALNTPKVTFRPYTLENVPLGAEVKDKYGDRYIITRAKDHKIFSGGVSWNYAGAVQYLVHAESGQPFGVAEEVR